MATMKELRGLTWYLFWRYTLVTLVGGYIVGSVMGFIAGFILAMLGQSSSVPIAGGIVGAVGGILVSFFALNFLLARMIGRQFGDHTLRFDCEDSSGRIAST